MNIAGTVLCDKDGRYLMIQEKRADIYGLWNIPAGHQDEGETLQQTAIRETYEETGLKVELLTSKPAYTGPSANPNYAFNAFPAKIIGGELRLPDDEILQAQWLTFDEIEQLNKQGKIRHYSTMASIERVEYENYRH